MVRVVHLVDPHTTSDGLLGLSAVAREGDLVLRLGPVRFPLPLGAEVRGVHRPFGRTSLTTPGQLWDLAWPVHAWSIPCARLALPIARRHRTAAVLAGLDAESLAGQWDLRPSPDSGLGLTACVPTAAGRKLLIRDGYDAANVAVVPPAAQVAGAVDRNAIRRRLGLGPQHWLIVAPEPMDEPDAPKAAAWAFAALRLLRPHARLVLPFAGAALPAVRRFADQTGFGKDILLAPAGAEPLDIMACGDAALLCARRTMPIFLASAMAARLAVVAVRSAVAIDLTGNGQAAVLVNSGRARDCAAALLELIDQPQRASQLGQRAGELARRRFDADGVRARLETIYAARAASPVGPVPRGTL